ncbi:hypothetical protein bpr_II371 (plasmid) [Butyrivibrio proteoclasticus B316]|uniref:Phage integrase family protein n=1 Tax=Butyrivibrio proteoclasticus (strain ATCC 51982 / DSM 14932 / B316) TaxID=515622 RepID=E0S4H6_BUTPB|nr:hypothetical protein [Butyrivibrio proteoclasticus]ADL36308.1 hypothetical protein bpr_II371 [Butyrivibrio proteoclasticus B316]
MVPYKNFNVEANTRIKYPKIFTMEIYKNNDFNIVLAQQFLQHSSVVTTQRYIGITSEMQEKALLGHIQIL